MSETDTVSVNAFSVLYMYESQFVYLRVAMGGPLSLSHVLLSSGRVPFIQAVGSEKAFISD